MYLKEQKQPIVYSLVDRVHNKMDTNPKVDQHWSIPNQQNSQLPLQYGKRNTYDTNFIVMTSQDLQ